MEVRISKPVTKIKGDDIIDDSGFIIEDLLVPLGVNLNSPPFLGKQDQLVGSDQWGC